MIIRGAAASACAALVFLLFGSAAAFAQSGIAGVVKDTSGGVMPGVTVDAASPALIEKVRTAVTDSEGRYRLDDLRPGAYTVTFGLPGFTTVKREGIQLPTAFTATVNVEMRVGDVSESITVTGEAPTVDIHSVTTHNVFSQKVVEALPSLRSAHQFARLAPSVTSVQLQDASSSNKDQFNIAAYGGRIGETIPMIDGVATTNRVGGGSGGTNMRLTSSYVQEVHVVLAGGTAEQAFGGVVMNVIPKEGGNTFAVGSYIDYAPGTLQSDNLTDELRAKGAPSINKTLRQYDFNPYGGGPIAKNKIWVFAGYRNALINQTVAGTYADTNVRDWVYTPDLSQPAENKTTDFSYNARLTWQISRFNKVSVFGEHQPHVNYNRHIEFGHAPEGATYTLEDAHLVTDAAREPRVVRVHAVHSRACADRRPQRGVGAHFRDRHGDSGELLAGIRRRALRRQHVPPHPVLVQPVVRHRHAQLQDRGPAWMAEHVLHHVGQPGHRGVVEKRRAGPVDPVRDAVSADVAAADGGGVRPGSVGDQAPHAEPRIAV